MELIYEIVGRKILRGVCTMRDFFFLCTTSTLQNRWNTKNVAKNVPILDFSYSLAPARSPALANF